MSFWQWNANGLRNLQLITKPTNEKRGKLAATFNLLRSGGTYMVHKMPMIVYTSALKVLKKRMRPLTFQVSG